MIDEEKEHIEFNLKCIKTIMNNFEDNICEEMENRVDDVSNYISKLQKILDSFETECRKNLATFRKIRKSEKRDIDLFNQGQEYKCCQFLNLLNGEENWSYEGKYFDKVDEDIEKYNKEV